MTPPNLTDLLAEYDRSLSYTKKLQADLSPEQIVWRAGENASSIGWHLGHQAAVAHFMMRNLIAAEPSLDSKLDILMDSATPEPSRKNLPSVGELHDYREKIAYRVRSGISTIIAGNVSAPNQLNAIALSALTTIINHEYQHDKWIGEVRQEVHGLDLPDQPESKFLTVLDDYLLIKPG